MDRTTISSMRVAHLGKILANIAILGAVVCLATVLYYVFIALYYLVLVGILLGTMFLILIPYPEFMKLFTNTEAINDLVVSFTTKYVPVIAPVTLVISALAITALVVSKQKNVTDRLVTSIVCALIALVFTFIFTFMGGGAQ